MDTIGTVRNLPECDGKVAILGYCFGALMRSLTAVATTASMLQLPITAAILRSIWERSMGLPRPFSCIWPGRMNCFQSRPG